MHRNKLVRVIVATVGLAFLALTSGGCAKKLVVHYVQVETCKTWSDVNDEAAAAYVQPLVVFRIVSMTNNSDSAKDFNLGKVFYKGANSDHFREPTAIPAFESFSTNMIPGQTMAFPHPSLNLSGLFPIQLWGEGYDDITLINLELFLSYKGQGVRMVRDPNIHSYYPYCGKTSLSSH